MLLLSIIRNYVFFYLMHAMGKWSGMMFCVLRHATMTVRTLCCEQEPARCRVVEATPNVP